MQRRDLLLPIVLILLFGSACFCFDGLESEPESSRPEYEPPVKASASATSVTADGPFAMSSPTVSEASVPDRFGAGLPTTLRGFEDVESYPPMTQFEGWVCAGTHDARQRVVEAVQKAAANGTLEGDVFERYRRMLRYCTHPSFCSWLEDVLSRESLSSDARNDAVPMMSLG